MSRNFHNHRTHQVIFLTCQLTRSTLCLLIKVQQPCLVKDWIIKKKRAQIQ